ncbi:MAG: hypothetical protein U0168_22135, partial [Nannocystaceae bacterium]
MTFPRAAALLSCLCACGDAGGGEGGNTSLTVGTGMGDTSGAGTSGSTGTGATVGTSAGSGTADSSSTAAATEGPIFDVGGGPGPDMPGEEGPVIPTTCDEALAGESTVGCLFYATDLDQNGPLESDQYAIAVSNPQDASPANVVIEQKVGGAWQEVASMVVPALSLHPFPLPDLHQQSSGVLVGGAYRVSSDVPIVAYQFNPLIMGSYSSDASMLYPVPAWDSLNRALHWGGGYGRG